METNLNRQIKFSILLSIQIPSIICYLFLLYHLLFKRSMRRSLNNHVFILICFIGLITILIDLSMILDYLHRGIVQLSSPTYCLIWNFLDHLLYSLTDVLMLWASIERHILIFYKSVLNTRRKRFLIHYVPLITVPIYLILIYIVILFLYPCENNFDYTQVICGGLCHENYVPWLEIIDRLIHDMIPVCLVVLSSICLIGQVIWQKHYRLRLPVQCHRHRKMALQMFPISVLYLCTVFFPYGTLDCINTFSVQSNISINVQQLYFFYLFYLLAQLLPFAYLTGMPKLYSKIFFRRTTRITPIATQLRTHHL